MVSLFDLVGSEYQTIFGVLLASLEVFAEEGSERLYFFSEYNLDKQNYII